MAESSLTYLDAYCERAGDASFWAEPLNALTNFSFIVFSVLSYLQFRPLVFNVPQTSDNILANPLVRYADILILMIVMFAIGVGSGLWHTLATPASLLADVIPIAIFINIYFFSLYKRVMGWSWLAVVVLWIGFQVISVGAEILLPSSLLNGSIMYVPTVGLLLLSTAILFAQNNHQWQRIMVVTGIFILSLSFRTIDLSLCEHVSIGTHFIWHTINGYVLYCFVVVLISTELQRLNR